VSSSPRPGWRWALVAAFLLSALICTLLAVTSPENFDVTIYKQWSRLVTIHGIQSAYAGEIYAGFSDYPPFLLYVFQAIGHVYELTVDPSFSERTYEGDWYLRMMIQAASIAFHLLLGLALFSIARRAFGAASATLVSCLYLLNPAVLYDIGRLGLPDAANSLWLVLAFGLVRARPWPLSWVAMGLAAATKPQAWVLGPLFLARQVLTHRPARVVAGAAVAGLTVGALISPFVLSGRASDLLRWEQVAFSLQAVASANAHNVWWILTNGAAASIQDSERFLGPWTYLQVGGALVAAVTIFTIYCCVRTSSSQPFLLEAYQAFSWFFFTTEAHENHPIFVLPFLVLALPARRWLWPFYVAITCSILANLVLEDGNILPSVSAIIPEDVQVQHLQIANAWLNLLIFGAWTVCLLLEVARFGLARARLLPSPG
jgi:Gpi18-like mannosyltransferase